MIAWAQVLLQIAAFILLALGVFIVDGKRGLRTERTWPARVLTAISAGCQLWVLVIVITALWTEVPDVLVVSVIVLFVAYTASWLRRRIAPPDKVAIAMPAHSAYKASAKATGATAVSTQAPREGP